MDFAARSALLTAAGVEMSGLGAPFGTARTQTTLVTGVALLTSTVLEATADANGAMMRFTSRGWPFATSCRVSTPFT